MTESADTGRVPTWRDGVILSLHERAQLTPEQWRQFSSDSMVRDLTEIDQMPDHTRAWASQVVEKARARTRIARAGAQRGIVTGQSRRAV